jgi:hypothetical protein
MFVPYESGPIDENTRGVYTHIKGEYSIRRDGIFVTVTSADGMEIEIHKVSDDGSSCLIKGTAHPELGEDDSN